LGPKQRIHAASGTLVDSHGDKVDAIVSSPDAPFAKNIAEPVLALLPRRPLRPGEEYTVTFQAVVDGQSWRQSWKFTTAGP
jgi:hypothetical protein